MDIMVKIAWFQNVQSLINLKWTLNTQWIEIIVMLFISKSSIWINTFFIDLDSLCKIRLINVRKYFATLFRGIFVKRLFCNISYYKVLVADFLGKKIAIISIHLELKIYLRWYIIGFFFHSGIRLLHYKYINTNSQGGTILKLIQLL